MSQDAYLIHAEEDNFDRYYFAGNTGDIIKLKERLIGLALGGAALRKVGGRQLVELMDIVNKDDSYDSTGVVHTVLRNEHEFMFKRLDIINGAAVSGQMAAHDLMREHATIDIRGALKHQYYTLDTEGLIIAATDDGYETVTYPIESGRVPGRVEYVAKTLGCYAVAFQCKLTKGIEGYQVEDDTQLFSVGITSRNGTYYSVATILPENYHKLA